MTAPLSEKGSQLTQRRMAKGQEEPNSHPDSAAAAGPAGCSCSVDKLTRAEQGRGICSPRGLLGASFPSSTSGSQWVKASPRDVPARGMLSRCPSSPTYHQTSNELQQLPRPPACPWSERSERQLCWQAALTAPRRHPVRHTGCTRVCRDLCLELELHQEALRFIYLR